MDWIICSKVVMRSYYCLTMTCDSCIILSYNTVYLAIKCYGLIVLAWVKNLIQVLGQHGLQEQENMGNNITGYLYILTPSQDLQQSLEDSPAQCQTIHVDGCHLLWLPLFCQAENQSRRWCDQGDPVLFLQDFPNLEERDIKRKHQSKSLANIQSHS